MRLASPIVAGEVDFFGEDADESLFCGPTEIAIPSWADFAAVIFYGWIAPSWCPSADPATTGVLRATLT